jgi:hypothetical protein
MLRGHPETVGRDDASEFALVCFCEGVGERSPFVGGCGDAVAEGQRDIGCDVVIDGAGKGG